MPCSGAILVTLLRQARSEIKLVPGVVQRALQRGSEFTACSPKTQLAFAIHPEWSRFRILRGCDAYAKDDQPHFWT
jgi:hypothetical protein